MNAKQLTYAIDEVLRDGQAVTIRAIRSDDRERLEAHFMALSPDSRYRRFFGLRHNFGPRELDRLTAPDYPLHLALVATIEDQNGDEVIIGDARCVAAPAQPDVTELALSVSDAWQGRGVATILMEHLVRCARSAGLTRLTAEVLASNAPALRFLVGHGFRVAGRASGVCSLVRFVEKPAASSPEDETSIAAIRERAYLLYLARGGRDGMDFDDWLTAERAQGAR
ncbi:MAG TPA: GNAT family N-acetyltransferase [Candidatus Binataceae bacterium]|nr:GNAT family N-acetyltransferase [Candidatus Binataceae bacterium]